ncbi:MAG TPA: IS66 family transposase [Verrucomicrobiales bacterium]|nr:IS66 family transposase [Verrucomicrobiales bacterium]
MKEAARKKGRGCKGNARFAALVLSEEQRSALLDAIRGKIAAEHFELIEAMTQAFPELLGLLEQKGMSISRLRRIAFGASTEKTAALCREGAAAEAVKAPGKTKRKGHGRRPASSYTGAKRVPVSHPTLKAGDGCPDCQKGKVRTLPEPAPVIKVRAAPPITATVYEMEVLRCSLCGKTFTAPTPEEAGQEKYEPSVGVMVALLRYGNGMPFNRLEGFQETLEIPLPSSNQWEEAKKTAQPLRPVFECLKWTAAQARTLFNDDTTMRIGDLRRQIQAEKDPERTGIFTSSIVAEVEDHHIALFFTGRKHAGERLDELLRLRDTALPPPMQICDALSRNWPKRAKTLLGSCLCHGRRPFVEVAESFPQECLRVLKSVRIIYRVESRSKAKGYDAQERLAFHQRRSKPVMDKLKRWLEESFEQKLVEPNSGFGQAFNYLLGHWEKLTLFLREPGAPLDNNICERALKMAIRHRKNSLSYKTPRGAEVGDLFMSLIHTCRLNRVNPHHYLTALVGNASAVEADPARWLPWNYKEPLAAASPPQALSA